VKTLPAGDDEPVLISLMDGFRLTIGGDVPVLAGGSQRLLGFLALREEAVPRPVTAATLWPGIPLPRALASLRSALSRLDSVTRAAIRASARDLGLAEGVVVDVRQATALARRLLDPEGRLDTGDLSLAAVSTLSRDVLPDWYDDWVITEADGWRQLRLRALDALSARLTDRERFADAARAAFAALRADPFRESARAALIRVHLAEGNQSDALAEFERYRALLHAELGLEPTPRLTELVGALKRPRAVTLR
jgi:DNA-binding SARP family transcriptional activator